MSPTRAEILVPQLPFTGSLFHDKGITRTARRVRGARAVAQGQQCLSEGLLRDDVGGHRSGAEIRRMTLHQPHHRPIPFNYCFIPGDVLGEPPGHNTSPQTRACPLWPL